MRIVVSQEEGCSWSITLMRGNRILREDFFFDHGEALDMADRWANTYKCPVVEE